MHKRFLDSQGEELNQENSKKSRYDVIKLEENCENASNLLASTMLLTGHSGAIYSIAFDPSGQNLASASYDQNIFLWKTSGECENYSVLEGHKNAVLEIHWDMSGSKIFSCSADKTVGLWDANKGCRIRKLTSHNGIVNSCSAAQQMNSLFASGSDDCSAIIWDCRDKLPVQTFWHDYQVTSVCIDSSAEYLYTGGIDNIIRRWDLRMSSTTPNMTLCGHGNTITGLSLNFEGTHLLSNGMDSNLFVWDIRPYVLNENQRYEKKFEGARHGAEQVLLKCNWSSPQSDGSSFVSCGSADRIVHVWDANNSQPVYYLPGHKGSVNQVVFHPSQRIIASCGSDKQIFLGELS